MWLLKAYFSVGACALDIGTLPNGLQVHMASYLLLRYIQSCNFSELEFHGILTSCSRKGLRSRGPIIMLVLVVYFYATCATQWALNFSDAFKNVHHLLMDLDTPIQDRLDLENKSRAPGSAAQEALWVSNVSVKVHKRIFNIESLFR